MSTETIFARDRSIFDPASGTTYIPYIAPDGRVGYRCERDRVGDPLTHVYFNPSVNEDPTEANVFIYVGAEDDPALDATFTTHVLTWEGP